MAPALVGTPGAAVFSATSVANPTNLAPTTGTGYAVGDTLLCFTACRSATPTVATPAGWTSLLNITGTNGRLALFGKVATSTSEAAPTVAWSGLTTGNSGTPCGARIQAVSGLEATIAVDVTGTIENGAASTTVSASGTAITTVTANDLVLALSTRLDDAGTWSAPAGFTLVNSNGSASGSDFAFAWAYQVQAAPGSSAPADFGLASASSFASSGVQVALKPLPAPTITPVARISLAAGGEPETRTLHSIKARARKASGSGTVELNAALYEGATNRSGDLSTALTTTLADYTLAVPDVGAAAITSYANLELRVWTDSPTGDAVAVEVAKLSLETPPAVVPPTWTRTPSDALGITDSIGIALGEAIADPMGMTDARAFDQTASLADPVGLADLAALARASFVADPLGVVDLTARQSGKEQTLADPVAVTDTRVFDFAGLIADPVALTDVQALLSVTQRTVADALALADLVDPQWAVGAVAHSVPLADLLGITDAGAAAPTLPVTSGLAVWLDASALGLADGAAVSPWANLGSGPDAPIVGTPAPTLQTNELNGLPVVRFALNEGRVRMTGSGVDDTWTVAYVGRISGAVAARVVGAIYPPPNMIIGWHGALQDVAYNTGGGFYTPGGTAATPNWKLYSADGTTGGSGRLFSDGMLYSSSNGALTDGWDGSFAISGYDATGLAETSDCEIAEVVVYDRVLTDVERQQVEDYLRAKWLEPAAPSGAGLLFGRGLAQPDALTLADLVSRARDIGATFADPLNLADSAALLAAYQRTQADPLGLADLVSPTRDMAAALADLLGVADSTATVVVLARTVADPVGLTDSPLLEVGLSRTLADPVAITDTTGAAIILLTQMADSLGFTDARAMSVGLNPADPLGITDSKISTAVLSRAVSDTLGLTDSSSALIVVLLPLADQIGLADISSLVNVYTRAFSDPVALTDLSAPAAALTRAVADPVGLTDLTAGEMQRARTVADAVALADSLNQMQDLVRSLDDPLWLADQPGFEQGLDLAELLVMLDDVSPVVHLPVKTIGLPGRVRASSSGELEVSQTGRPSGNQSSRTGRIVR